MGHVRGPAGWEATVDVAVVGFGGAGACAAIEAAQRGARVMALDRYHGGGATGISGAVVYAGGGTPYQRAAGYEDTPEEMHRYLHQEVNGAVSDETLWRFCESSREDLAWLEALGVPFEASLCPFKTSYPTDDYFLYFSGNELVHPYRSLARPAPRGHRVRGKGRSGTVLFERLSRAAVAHGIEIRTQSHVQHLVTDNDGRVVGLVGRALPHGSRWRAIHAKISRFNAKVSIYVPPLARRLTALLHRIEERHALPFRVHVRRGAVLAAGGFIMNRAMVRRLAPGYAGSLPLGTMGDDGSGITMGQAAGGVVGRMDRGSMWRFLSPPEALMRGVVVDGGGKRFCNEDLYGATLGEQILAHGGDAWLVFDRDTWREAMQQQRTQTAWFQFWPMLYMLRFGRVKAPTQHDLARKTGLPQETLETTLGEYNARAGRGKADPLGKSPDLFRPQVRSPYYALDCSPDASPLFPCPTMTLGGLVVDEATGQVKDAEGSPIKGLYAAGRNAVGICSEAYVSGLAIADAVFSGRRAGRHAAGADPADGLEVG